eukprot:5290203-Alexandrium_andersonii.AAC.1
MHLAHEHNTLAHAGRSIYHNAPPARRSICHKQFWTWERLENHFAHADHGRLADARDEQADD